MTPDRGSQLRSPVRAVIWLALGMIAVGIPVGVVWWRLAPRGEVTVVDGGVVLSETASQAFVAADGWFAFLTLAAGILCGTVVAVRRRPDGIPAAIALTVGGVIAAIVAWRVGVFLGRQPDALDKARSSSVGTVLPVGLRLRATGVLLTWAIGAIATFFAATLAAGRMVQEADMGWSARGPYDVSDAPPG